MKPVRDKAYQNEREKTIGTGKSIVRDVCQRWLVSNGLKKIFLMLLLFVSSAVILVGCNEPADKRANLTTGVNSSTLADNVLTRPVYGAFTLLAGYGIELKDVKVFRNEAGFMEIQVTGYNSAVYKKRFDYKVDWLDNNGMAVDSKASVWTTISAKSRTVFYFTVIAPAKEVVDYRINTRETPKKG
ncbi:MAG: YcfL family protein [Phycisphaerae bacterium]|jgi:hypothetical protein